MRSPAATALVLLTACWGAPTPLAPALGGSVGLPHNGVLTEGRALPDSGAGYQRYRSDGINWGNARMVVAIERAAAAVAAARPGGAPLIVADLSAKVGGKIDRHRSHRTGRDADLLFYVVTPAGRSVKNPGFIHFGTDGVALASKRDGSFVRLDVDRTWLLVRQLVLDDAAQVQYLFVARWLEALLIEHAMARGEDDETLLRAELVLRQPSDSFAHADHIHLRIACSDEEKAAGCMGGGPERAWFPSAPVLPVRSDDQLIALLFDDDERALLGRPESLAGGRAKGRAAEGGQ